MKGKKQSTPTANKKADNTNSPTVSHLASIKIANYSMLFLAKTNNLATEKVRENKLYSVFSVTLWQILNI